MKTFAYSACVTVGLLLGGCAQGVESDEQASSMDSELRGRPCTQSAEVGCLLDSVWGDAEPWVGERNSELPTGPSAINEKLKESQTPLGKVVVYREGTTVTEYLQTPREIIRLGHSVLPPDHVSDIKVRSVKFGSLPAVAIDLHRRGEPTLSDYYVVPSTGPLYYTGVSGRTVEADLNGDGTLELIAQLDGVGNVHVERFVPGEGFVTYFPISELMEVFRIDDIDTARRADVSYEKDSRFGPVVVFKHEGKTYLFKLVEGAKFKLVHKS